ncbi:MAG: hypothetical protein EP348_06040 [Alphaproteobacteria bacterium]|nr:MAG: hypothetical protein EP348_06040 [Alphaproteobacteria bacterium]
MKLENVTAGKGRRAIGRLSVRGEGDESFADGRRRSTRKANFSPQASASSTGPVRRTSCARLFAALDDDQVRSFERIARGFELRTSGLGMRTQSFSPLPRGGGRAEDRQVLLMQRFSRWAETVQNEGLSLAAILDVIAFGKSCRRVDRERRKRNGYAREQLYAGLDLYFRNDKHP